MRCLPFVVLLLPCAIGVVAAADDAETRSTECQAAMQAYRASAPTADTALRLQTACYYGAARAPVLRAPVSVGGAAPAAVPVIPPAPEIRLPASPQVLTQCDTGGCWDNLGQRYSGPGPVYSGPGGAVCTRNGDRIECR